MTCQNPKTAWQRRFMPIDGNKSEKNFKRLNKISFSYKQGWEQIQIPCGECPACKLAKANEWAIRISNEMEQWNGEGIFITLTYNNPNLPYNKDGIATLQKKDMQDYKKRLRKYIKKNNEAIHEWINPKNGKCEKIIRTFECGEYGPTNGRPHYHQIITNWIPSDLKFKEMSKDGHALYKSKTLQKIWGKGFVLIGMITYESASYVARYTMKKQGLAKQKREYYDTLAPDEETGKLIMKTKYRIKQGEIEPEFITMSQGIGKNYFLKHKNEIKINKGILVNIKGEAKLKKIPRYYKKIWEKLNWEEYEAWKLNYKNHMQEKINKMINEYKLPQNYHIWDKEYFYKKKILDNQKHKFRLLKRTNITYDEDEDIA